MSIKISEEVLDLKICFLSSMRNSLDETEIKLNECIGQFENLTPVILR